MNKLGIWGIAIAAAFVVGLIISSSLAFAPPGQQGTKFQELWDAIFGLQTQFDDLEERVAALENPTPPPPPEPEIELLFFIDDQQVLSFSGAQVVHMVLFDPNIDDTDEAKGVPDVTVNGDNLILTQGIDGNWHAFFADSTNALIADSEVTVPGIGSDFGAFCSKISGNVLGPTIDVTETEGFAVQDPALVTNAVDGNAAGTPLTNECTDPNPTETPNDFMAVLNGVVDINPNFPSQELDGQSGIRKGFWPFIHLFSFIEGAPVDVRYNVGGESLPFSLTFGDPIIVSTAKQKFERGETILFSITATPNEQLTVSIEDPLGNEVLCTTLDIPSSGSTNLEYLTNFFSPEGTYTLFAMQDGEFEIFMVGLGELPAEQLVVKMDMLNYASNTNAKAVISGPQSVTVSLILIDPSDKEKFSDLIVLDENGLGVFEFSLSGFSNGVYSMVATRGNAQASDVFSVGLQTGSGEINVRTTKDTYQRGETILILGSSGDNILLTLTLTDPEGNVEKTKETFTNSDGVFSATMRIPVDAQVGVWTVNAKSGPNFDTTEITVIGSEEGLMVFVKSIVPSPAGTIVTISGHGAVISQFVILNIFSEDGQEVEELKVLSTGVGEFEIPWVAPKDLAPGKYTIKAHDVKNEAETTFVLE